MTELYDYFRTEVVDKVGATARSFEDTQKIREFVLLYTEYVDLQFQADLAYIRGVELRDQAYSSQKYHPDWEDTLDESIAFSNDAERLSCEAEKVFTKATEKFKEIPRGPKRKD